jgi:hypothetical protein
MIRPMLTALTLVLVASSAWAGDIALDKVPTSRSMITDDLTSGINTNIAAPDVGTGMHKPSLPTPPAKEAKSSTAKPVAKHTETDSWSRDQWLTSALDKDVGSLNHPEKVISACVGLFLDMRSGATPAANQLQYCRSKVGGIARFALKKATNHYLPVGDRKLLQADLDACQQADSKEGLPALFEFAQVRPGQVSLYREGCTYMQQAVTNPAQARSKLRQPHHDTEKAAPAPIPETAQPTASVPVPAQSLPQAEVKPEAKADDPAAPQAATEPKPEDKAEEKREGNGEDKPHPAETPEIKPEAVQNGQAETKAAPAPDENKIEAKPEIKPSSKYPIAGRHR